MGTRTVFMFPSRRAYSSSTSCSSGVRDSASCGDAAYEACEAERPASGLSVAMSRAGCGIWYCMVRNRAGRSIGRLFVCLLVGSSRGR